MRKKLLISLLALLGVYVLLEWFFSEGTYEPAPQEAPAFPFQDARTSGGDSVWVRAGAHYRRTRAGEFFLGRHYREVWLARVKAPVFRIDSAFGGLTIRKLGGGMQTTSLTLTDHSGRSYTLRSIDKDPASVLPPFWRKTFVAKFVRDQISGSNPYAALVVAPLAEAAGVFHTNPQLAFVLPTDSSFREHTHLFTNRLFLIEEKYRDKASLTAAFGPAADIIDTEEMLENCFRSSRHRIDTALYARCRLFDSWIGDWDRHEGQWGWVAYRQESGVLYKPVPKDRDQAFCHYTDGLVPWLATRYYRDRKFTGFGHDYPSMAALSYNARFLDVRLLNGFSERALLEVARQLQQQLTDAAIDEAVQQFPPEVFALVGRETAAKLKARRDKLPEAARQYYRLLAEHVTVAGTDEAETFVVDALSREQVRVTVRVQEKMLYSRTFRAGETQRLQLYPLGGKDSVVVKGSAGAGKLKPLLYAEQQDVVRRREAAGVVTDAGAAPFVRVRRREK